MENKIRILLLENADTGTSAVGSQLAASHEAIEFKRVLTIADYQNALSAFHPEIILFEAGTKTITIEAACLQADAAVPNAMFILLVDRSGESLAISLMERYIDDYILKDKVITLPYIIRKVIESRKGEKVRETAFGKLKSQEQKFKAYLENSYESVSVFDENLKLIYRSPSITKLTGFTMEELNEISLVDMLHKDDVTKMQELFVRARANPGEPIRGTFRARNKLGQVMWLDAAVTNMLHDPNVKAYICNYRDITETKHYEEQLLQSGNYYKALLENISDAIIFISSERIIRYVSPSVKRTTGFAQEEMLGRDLFDFLHPQDLSNARTFLQSTIDTPAATRQNAYRLKHKKGGYIWVGGTLTNMLSDQSVNGLIINYRDITRRKHAQELLRKSEANLRTVFENTKVSYVLLDRHYKVVSFNHQAKKWYKPTINVDLEEGINIIEGLPAEKREESIRDFEKIFKGEKISYERGFPQKDGQIAWFQVDLIPVHDNFDAVLGLLISSEDITHRKTAEIERDKMTTEILQHNKNLEQFAYIISHNLRSPVANIMGLANLVTNAAQLSEQDFKKCIEGLFTTAQKLDSIISDLNYILQTKREVKESLESVSFGSIMEEVCSLLAEHIAKENISIVTSFKATKIYTVRSYLHSIFLNLITNSIKYRNPDVPNVIQVSTEIIDQNIHIFFSDNGLGIDLRANGDKIFGLYKKFHPHIEVKGMGLYLVKSQVEILGGRISIHSSVNLGTKFDISFPIRQEDIAQIKEARI